MPKQNDSDDAKHPTPRGARRPSVGKRQDTQSGRSDRQIDDNQDDLGRDANDPRVISNEINRVGPLPAEKSGGRVNPRSRR